MKKNTYPFRLLTGILFLLSTFSVAFSQSGNSLYFDGVNDVVNIPGASVHIANSSSGMSLSCWVYATNTSPSYPNFDGIAGFRNEATCDFYLLQLSATEIEARFRNSTGTNYDAKIVGFATNTWQHLVMTYDGTSLKAYLNGTQAASVPASGSISSTSEVMYLGKLPFLPNDFYLGGKLDEVALWNKALTASEISCMYNYGHDNSSANLKLYYNFDQGTANGVNTSITKLVDSKGNINGFINGFTLSGTSSNFVPGVVQAGSFATSICKGDSIGFGSSYYSKAGTYSVKIPVSGGCDSISKMVLTVDSVDNGITAISNGATLQANATAATYQWINCGTKQALPNGNQRTYIPITKGQFAVVVTQNGCSDTSACINSTVGLTENQLPFVSVFPNPTKGKFTLSQGLDFDGGQLEIINVAGVRVGSIPVSPQPETQIAVNLPAGVYMVNFYRMDGKRGAYRLVIER